MTNASKNKVDLTVVATLLSTEFHVSEITAFMCIILAHSFDQWMIEMKENIVWIELFVNRNLCAFRDIFVSSLQ